MALSFRRTRDAAPEAGASARVDTHTLHDLEKARTRRLTGALRVEDRSTGGVARIFLFQGYPYSVLIDGCSPRVPERLVASGLVTPEQAAEVAGSPRAGQRAVTRGWITADQLGSVHQELLLAGFGAVVTVEDPHLEFEEAAVTDLGCAAPVALDPLVESVPVRATRLASTWSTLVVGGDARTSVFLPTGTPLPQAVDRPEFRALLGTLGSGVGLDDAAWRSGFTRAEAVHLTGILAAAGVVALSPDHADGPHAGLLVPEEFGSVSIETATIPVPATPPSVPQGLPSGADVDALRTELHELQGALAAAVEEERQASARVAALRESVHELTEAVDGADAS